ncbi:hypothetical protein, partial [Escherichia coli]|uniref:hypothetical protein n=1 Tax=Escherichia coli TaxID=562 RepID=UPI001BC89D8D
VPAYGPQNDVTLKMPAFEWVHVQLHQQKGMISLSPPTICNSAIPLIKRFLFCSLDPLYQKKIFPLLTLDNWHYLKLVYNNDQTISIDRLKKSWFESRA